ncbi:VCBS domain-containing protein [Methylobacterium sp. E-045]|uniref:VCBS domain-containing protein n=1 Tax=Methylobacterium sp. E-045 TaxID=2836575 RepID=UPI001FBA0BE7|nr:VCBS domain-containing protein [Methylobacterium sp. E-045]MCJ2127800.1 Ig-like domain-containing protein [Methylobacterium sp. E-045]
MPSLVSELPTINENTLVVGYVGDTDANSATGESTTGITYAISKSFDGAKFQIDSNGLLSFRQGQAPNFESPTDSDNNGVYRVTVTARDSSGVLTSKTYNVNVADVNENPVAVLDTATVSDTAASDDGVGKLDVLAGAGVLKNDTDPDANSTRTVTSGSFGQNGTQAVVDGKVTLSGTYGTLTLFADGSYQYVANVELDKLQAGSNPVDVFNYTITDNGGLTSSSTLTINLKGANDAAVVAGDAAAA